jgi:hypothetical protein
MLARRQETIAAIDPTLAPVILISMFYINFGFRRRESLPAQGQEIKVLTTIKADADAARAIHRTCG